MASLETYRRFKMPLQLQSSRTLNNRSRSSQPSCRPSWSRARNKPQLLINRTTIQTQSNSKWYCLHQLLSLPQLQRFFRHLRRIRRQSRTATRANMTWFANAFETNNRTSSQMKERSRNQYNPQQPILQTDEWHVRRPLRCQTQKSVICSSEATSDQRSSKKKDLNCEVTLMSRWKLDSIYSLICG